MVDLFVRIAIGVLVGGLLGAGLAWATTVPAWGIGAAAGALSALVSSWALHSLRGSSKPAEPKPDRPDSPQQPSI